MTTKLFAFALFFFPLLNLKAGSSFIFGSDTSRMFYAKDNKIYSADQQQLLYFQKGNIFFKGTSDDRHNIFMLASTMNIEGDKTGYIYEDEKSNASLSFSNYKVYAGNNESNEYKQRGELLHIKPSGKWLAFYSSLNDSLLAYYLKDSLPPSAAVFVSYMLIKKHGLDRKQAEQVYQPAFIKASYSSIRPLWGNPTGNEWIWDGKILRPRWNIDPHFQWTFDGQTVKPVLGGGIDSEYSWDGETFKPTWRTDRPCEWSWDGRLIKPIWSTDWANQYTIENGIVKPWSNVHAEKEWRLEGDIPIPLIILVISGLAWTN